MCSASFKDIAIFPMKFIGNSEELQAKIFFSKVKNGKLLYILRLLVDAKEEHQNQNWNKPKAKFLLVKNSLFIT